MPAVRQPALQPITSLGCLKGKKPLGSPIGGCWCWASATTPQTRKPTPKPISTTAAVRAMNRPSTTTPDILTSSTAMSLQIDELVQVQQGVQKGTRPGGGPAPVTVDPEGPVLPAYPTRPGAPG